MIREGDKLLVGPSEDGDFLPVKVTSIYRNRTPTRLIRAGQVASVALSDIEKAHLRRVSEYIYIGFQRFQIQWITFVFLHPEHSQSKA